MSHYRNMILSQACENPCDFAYFLIWHGECKDLLSTSDGHAIENTCRTQPIGKNKTMAYQQLETEQLWNETVKQRNKAIRRQQNRLAVRGFTQFLFVIGVMAACSYALYTMPQWLPTVEAFMNENGVTDKLQQLKDWIG